MQSIKKSKLYGIIKKDLKAYDGKILLYKGEYCGGNDRCYGMFEFNFKENPVIKVAIGNKSNERWFGVLIDQKESEGAERLPGDFDGGERTGDEIMA